MPVSRLPLSSGSLKYLTTSTLDGTSFVVRLNVNLHRVLPVTFALYLSLFLFFFCFPLSLSLSLSFSLSLSSFLFYPMHNPKIYLFIFKSGLFLFLSFFSP